MGRKYIEWAASTRNGGEILRMGKKYQEWGRMWGMGEI